MTMKNTVVTLQKQKHEHDKITMVTARLHDREDHG